MTTVPEDSTMGGSLWAELFSGHIPKARQGRIVRQLTCLSVWLATWLGAWQLYETLRSGVIADFQSSSSGGYFLYGLPILAVAAGMWFGFRLVCWPRFASFLIDVESEMSKVSWPTKNELYKAAGVVIFTMAFMAAILFCFDLIWQFIFDWLRVS
jgi:preprotein translocase subunit SecE